MVVMSSMLVFLPRYKHSQHKTPNAKGQTITFLSLLPLRQHRTLHDLRIYLHRSGFARDGHVDSDAGVRMEDACHSG